ncbi:hypothetical protein MP478_01545 [Chryseobacterium sp. WG14]|uniref:hypothetical protein n=1 Tax=Chryseobacterium sp. WG14 TaxID=2926909 RepID=UPI00211DFC4A|nr:hypothetical protein [Chryseobacterium sp. WG14]MCQ9638056.1 hypothetical protein [Chryseobacterium sp. WG14]
MAVRRIQYENDSCTIDTIAKTLIRHGRIVLRVAGSSNKNCKNTGRVYLYDSNHDPHQKVLLDLYMINASIIPSTMLLGLSYYGRPFYELTCIG